MLEWIKEKVMRIEWIREKKWIDRTLYIESGIFHFLFGCITQKKYKQHVRELEDKDLEKLYFSLCAYVESSARWFLLIVTTVIVLGIWKGGVHIILIDYQRAFQEMGVKYAAEADVFGAQVILGLWTIGIGFMIAVKMYFFDYYKQLQYIITRHEVEERKMMNDDFCEELEGGRDVRQKERSEKMAE